MSDFTVKDSGKRQEFASGMRRDTDEGKPRYDLIDPAFLKRWAIHMAKGAVKYGEDNWRNANSEAELKRFKASALRHMFQWLAGDVEEDHASAIAFNVAAALMVEEKLYQPELALKNNAPLLRFSTRGANENNPD